jgi:hypothetical protein
MPLAGGYKVTKWINYQIRPLSAYNIDMNFTRTTLEIALADPLGILDKLTGKIPKEQIKDMKVSFRVRSSDKKPKIVINGIRLILFIAFSLTSTYEETKNKISNVAIENNGWSISEEKKDEGESLLIIKPIVSIRTSTKLRMNR